MSKYRIVAEEHRNITWYHIECKSWLFGWYTVEFDGPNRTQDIEEAKYRLKVCKGEIKKRIIEEC